MRYLRQPVFLAAITSALLVTSAVVAPFPAHAAVNQPDKVSVQAPGPMDVTAKPAKPTLATARMPHTWTVKPGQTLSQIAQVAYGNSALWPALWWVNKSQVRNPDLIQAGQVLKLSAWHPRTSWLSEAGQRAGTPVVRNTVVVTYHAVYHPVYHAYHRVWHRTYRRVVVSSTYHGSSSMEQCIISRESGGNSQVMNASGHYGLYQFSYSTWVASGGSPSAFGHASVAEQEAAFHNAVAARGYSDWAPYDGC